eukprot:1993167-Rhodomonas_salina.5
MGGADGIVLAQTLLYWNKKDSIVPKRIADERIGCTYGMCAWGKYVEADGEGAMCGAEEACGAAAREQRDADIIQHVAAQRGKPEGAIYCPVPFWMWMLTPQPASASTGRGVDAVRGAVLAGSATS